MIPVVWRRKPRLGGVVCSKLNNDRTGPQVVISFQICGPNSCFQLWKPEKGSDSIKRNRKMNNSSVWGG